MVIAARRGSREADAAATLGGAATLARAGTAALTVRSDRADFGVAPEAGGDRPHITAVALGGGHTGRLRAGQ